MPLWLVVVVLVDKVMMEAIVHSTLSPRVAVVRVVMMVRVKLVAMVLVETAEVELKVDLVEVLETEPTLVLVVLALVVQMQIMVELFTEVMLDQVEVVLVKVEQALQATHLVEMVELE